MPTEDIDNQRKRSRPVTKKSKIEIIKKNNLALGVVLVIVLVVVIGGLYVVLSKDKVDDNSNNTSANPVAVFDTSLGTFKVELYRNKMPITCDNFIRLANENFYDGMIFYRVLDNFMIQAGRYFPDGSEGTSPHGNIKFETSDVKHVDGAISMASTGVGVGGSAEFFICDGAQSFLDGNYAAFGVVIEGIEVVRDIAAQPQDGSSPAGGGKPYTDIIINSITIE